MTRPDEGRTRRGGRGSALLLAAVAIVATVAGARASSVLSSASSSWQLSVRRQLAQAEAIRDGLDGVYVKEAREAAQVVVARLRAEQLTAAAAGLPEPDRGAILALAGVESDKADQLAAVAGPLGRDPRYLTPTGIDVGRRLGDVRAEQGESPPDPAMSEKAGDRESNEGFRLVATTIPVGVAFLFGALAQGFPAVRRRLLRVGAGFLAVAVASVIVIGVTA